MTTRFDGADLSHYQTDKAPIDWPALRAASWWVATKATQGTGYRDPTFDAHWAQMGMGFTHRLAYHWLTPTADPTAQAAHFLATWDQTGGAMLDAEEGGITVAGVLAWCRTVEAQTRRPCSVYSGAFVAGGTIWRSPEVRNSLYGPRPMHLAAYTTEARALALPGVAANPWSAWQYSSNGPVPGVTGRCDMNRVDNVAHYDLACGIVAQDPPVPVPPSTIEDDMQLVVPNQRVYDSRNDPAGTLKAGQTRTIDLGKTAATAKAAAVNLTVTGKATAGFLVAFGTATPPPTSNVNFAAAQTEANVANVQVTGQRVNVQASAECDLIVDLQAVWP